MTSFLDALTGTYDDHKQYDEHVAYDAPGVIRPKPFVPEDNSKDEFNYFAVGLLSRQVLAELPFSGPEFNSMLGSPTEEFSGSLNIADSKIQKLDPIGATVPERTALFVTFGNLPVWGGIIWSRDYDSATKIMKVTAQEFGSFYVRQDIDADQVFVQVDQCRIAGDLVRYVRDKRVEANIRTVINQPPASKPRDRTYHGYEGKQVMEAIDQLSNVINGFDWYFDVRYGSTDKFEHVLTMSFPRRGARKNKTQLVLDYPGNIIKYRFPEDMSDRATHTTAVGSGEGPGMLLKTADDEARMAAGFPYTQASFSYKDIIIPSTLQDHADADLLYVSDRFRGMEVDVPILTAPRFGTYSVGDDARLDIVDERFPSGVVGADDVLGDLRLVGWKVRPEENLVTLTLASSVDR